MQFTRNVNETINDGCYWQTWSLRRYDSIAWKPDARENDTRRNASLPGAQLCRLIRCTRHQKLLEFVNMGSLGEKYRYFFYLRAGLMLVKRSLLHFQMVDPRFFLSRVICMKILLGHFVCILLIVVYFGTRK